MRRSLGIRLGTLILVVSFAMPAFAAPRDHSPFDGVGRAIRRAGLAAAGEKQEGKE